MKQRIFVLFFLSVFSLSNSLNSVVLEHEDKKQNMLNAKALLSKEKNTTQQDEQDTTEIKDQPSPTVEPKQEKYVTREKRSLKLAQKKAFAPVGQLHLLFSDEKRTKVVETYCTGTLIDPRTVIATADCIRPLIENKGFSFYYERDDSDNLFALGNDLWSETIAASHVESAVFYAGYQFNDSPLNAQNLALLFLKEPITTVKPAALYEGTLNSLYKKNVVYVGFGFTGDPVNGVKDIMDYRKRACEQKITTFKRTQFQTQFKKSPNRLSGMITHGDQGGPAFVKGDNGKWYLAGVNAFRLLPELDRLSARAKKDPRLVTYGTVGYSIAIPPYLYWIRENMGLKVVDRSQASEDSEWSFHPFWGKHTPPNNQAGQYYDVRVNSPGVLLLDRKYTIDKLVLEHDKAKLFLPRAFVIAASDDQIDEQASKLFTEGKKFESVEFRRTIIKRIDTERALQRSQLIASSVELDQGTFHVDGELWVDTMAIHGGTLLGLGEVYNGVNPVINYGGVVSPGGETAPGTLTIWGDYEQHDKTTKEPGGTLRIRVHKSVSPKGVRIKTDVLDVKGRVTLGGTLEIVETGSPLVHGDIIQVVLGLNGVVGKFSNIKMPLRFKANIDYGSDNIRLEVLDVQKLMPTKGTSDLTVRWGQEISLEDGSSLDRLQVDGGILQGNGSVRVISPLTVKSGIMRASPSAFETGKLVIDGDYRQTGGALALKMIKTLEEKQSIKGELQLTVIEPAFTWSNDSLEVTGNAHLSGHLELLASFDARLQNGAMFTLIKAKKIEGKFDSVTEFPGALQPALIYTPTEVKVQFVARPFQEITEAMGDPRVLEMAQYLDTLRNDEQKGQQLRPLFNMLDLVDKRSLENFMKMLMSQQIMKAASGVK